MRLLYAATIIGLSVAMPAYAQSQTSLVGDWIVDLRPSPSAPAYLKPMTISVGSDGAVAGTFYDRPIEMGRASSVGDRQCFSLRTVDNSGPYHTSGCLVGDRIEGQTWSEGRAFLLIWTAVRGVLTS